MTAPLGPSYRATARRIFLRVPDLYVHGSTISDDAKYVLDHFMERWTADPERVGFRYPVGPYEAWHVGRAFCFRLSGNQNHAAIVWHMTRLAATWNFPPHKTADEIKRGSEELLQRIYLFVFAIHDIDQQVKKELKRGD